MNTLKYAIRQEWYNLVLLLLPFVVMPFIWSHLPDQIPTHWNFQGEVDDYSNKTVGLLIVPLINIGVYLILLYLPKIDPKNRITIDQKPIPILRTLIVLLLLGIHSWIIAVAIGIELNSANWIYLGLAVFFIVMGNYLRTIQPNYFIGIRVPWALENEGNWRKTHQIGAYTWVIGGLLLIILFPLVNQKVYPTIFGVVATCLALIPTLYSFYIYKTKA